MGENLLKNIVFKNFLVKKFGGMKISLYLCTRFWDGGPA